MAPALVDMPRLTSLLFLGSDGTLEPSGPSEVYVSLDSACWGYPG